MQVAFRNDALTHNLPQEIVANIAHPPRIRLPALLFMYTHTPRKLRLFTTYGYVSFIL